MLEKVKLALRIMTNEFDSELQDLICAAKGDMHIAGVNACEVDPEDPLITRAVITYCKMHFGEPDQYDRLKASYDEQKAQLSNASYYTTWEVNR